jgi:hypothetical protein
VAMCFPFSFRVMWMWYISNLPYACGANIQWNHTFSY